MSFLGGGGGGGDPNAWMYQQLQQSIDQQRADIQAQNATQAQIANQKRLNVYSTGGMAALASNGYAGYGANSKPLGGTTQPLGA